MKNFWLGFEYFFFKLKVFKFGSKIFRIDFLNYMFIKVFNFSYSILMINILIYVKGEDNVCFCIYKVIYN